MLDYVLALSVVESVVIFPLPLLSWWHKNNRDRAFTSMFTLIILSQMEVATISSLAGSLENLSRTSCSYLSLLVSPTFPLII